MKDFSKLEQKLGLEFKNKDLLVQAIVHRSYLNEHPKFKLGHNERLEFLGDAVLELIVTEYLYQNYPNPEGELTNWRASLVNAHMLSLIAKELDLYHYLYLSRGEAKENNKKAQNYILANAFEALIGAIYLDQGINRVKKFIEKFILVKLPEILTNKSYLDPKSLFQEKSQELLNITPTYRVLDESGPDHVKHFRIGVYLKEEIIAIGEGASKQEAQVEAASNALEKKGW